MRPATPEYLQEEARSRHARPRLKAVVYPFDLDIGLAAGSGAYVNTEYGGEAGKLAMQAGYYTSGSWTGPVSQAHTDNLNRVVPAWTNQAGYLDLTVQLRTGIDYAACGAAAWVSLAAGQEYELSRYFQFKFTLAESIRAWAVDDPGDADAYTMYAVDQAPDGGYESWASDGEFPGYLEDITMTGQLSLAEEEIIAAGDVNVEMALDFSDMTVGDLSLVLNNRNRQWLPASPGFYLQAVSWWKKFVKVYHGFDLPDRTTAWQLQFVGQVEKLTDMAHGWDEAHRATLELADLVRRTLETKIGTPAADGTKQPFMRGYYYAKAENTGTDASSATAVKTGSGSATLHIVDDAAYSGSVDQVYLIQAETTGEIGAATLRWSKDGGYTWEKIGIVAPGAVEPLVVENDLEVYWTGGDGNDFVAGDQWEITCIAKLIRYKIPGAPFQEITSIYVADDDAYPGVSYSADSGEITVKGKSGSVEARVVKDDTTHPVDIIEDILHEVGLGDYIDATSFALARSDTLSYQIGCRFENVQAGKAIREIVGRCLYDFWVDRGAIYLRAYLGES